MKVVILPAALDDLADIGRFIAGDNPRRADSFVAEIEDRCVSLGDNPRAFPLLPRHESVGIRRCPHANYLIFYRVSEVVEVLRVLHGARDLDAVIFSEG